jgi:hypothetical protein
MPRHVVSRAKYDTMQRFRHPGSPRENLRVDEGSVELALVAVFRSDRNGIVCCGGWLIGHT